MDLYEASLIYIKIPRPAGAIRRPSKKENQKKKGKSRLFPVEKSDNLISLTLEPDVVIYMLL